MDELQVSEIIPGLIDECTTSVARGGRRRPDVLARELAMA